MGGWGAMGSVRVGGNGQWEVEGQWGVWRLGQWAKGGWGAMGNVRVGGIYLKFNYYLFL